MCCSIAAELLASTLMAQLRSIRMLKRSPNSFDSTVIPMGAALHVSSHQGRPTESTKLKPKLKVSNMCKAAVGLKV